MRQFFVRLHWKSLWPGSTAIGHGDILPHAIGEAWLKEMQTLYNSQHIHHWLEWVSRKVRR